MQKKTKISIALFSVLLFLGMGKAAFAEEFIKVSTQFPDPQLAQSLVSGHYYTKVGNVETQKSFVLYDENGEELNDITSETWKDCYISETQALEVNKLATLKATESYKGLGVFKNLKDLDLASGVLKVDVSECKSLETLHAPGRVEELYIGEQPHLYKLNLIANHLSTENLKEVLNHCPNLTNYVGWYGEQEKGKATSIDFSKNTKLEEVYIKMAGFEDIQLCAMPNLKVFSADHNNFKALDFSEMPKLQKVLVDDNYQLGQLNLKENTQLEMLACTRCNNITNLDLSGKSKLTSIYAAFNKIEQLDLSQNPLLTHLEIQGNALQHLDISGLAFLEYVDASRNSLKNLTFEDLGEQTKLKELYLDFNEELMEPNLSKFPNLLVLSLNADHLTDIDVRKNTELTDLGIAYNDLTTLDISKNYKLSNLQAECNHLTNVDKGDLKNYPSVTKLSEQTITRSLSTVSGKKGQVYYAVSCQDIFGSLVDVATLSYDSQWTKNVLSADVQFIYTIKDSIPSYFLITRNLSDTTAISIKVNFE